MKKLTFLAIMAMFAILLTNCEEEETTKVDFNIVVTGESPNAIVQLTNTSDSADLYTWEFSEGANIETSEETNPQLLVDKTGEFTITLTATIGKKEVSKTKKVTITGVNGISNFENVEFGTIYFEDSIGIFFSCETGLTYTASELNSSIKSIIDFAIKTNNLSVIYSPNRYEDPIVGYRKTKFNGNIDNSFTISEFNAINDEQLLLNFSIAESENFIIESDEFPKVILMRDYEGKWGAIKFKEHLTDRVFIDVKIQKYLNDNI